jgi:hypothetical protein
MTETPKIDEIIQKFFDAFTGLSPDEKRSFLVQFDKTLAGKSEKERKLYLALLKCAREGKTSEQTIDEMKKV